MIIVLGVHQDHVFAPISSRHIAFLKASSLFTLLMLHCKRVYWNGKGMELPAETNNYAR